jgi:hypothetical protein
MREETRQKLELCAEEKYKDFSAALVPGEETMLGVRLPKLRETAKELAKGNWEEELTEEDIYFEEIMLRGMVISYATLKMAPEKALEYVKDFIPRVRNWSVCDSVFMKMDVLKKDRDLTWEFLLPYLQSGEEFKVRVALIIMMAHLLRCDAKGCKMSRLRKVTMDNLKEFEREKKQAGKYVPLILENINRPFKEGYYAHMAAAWLVAESFCCFPAMTDNFLKTCRLDDATYNKALQKIVESKIPEEDVKDYIRSLKK